jgi:hypothetical protein
LAAFTSLAVAPIAIGCTDSTYWLSQGKRANKSAEADVRSVLELVGSALDLGGVGIPRKYESNGTFTQCEAILSPLRKNSPGNTMIGDPSSGFTSTSRAYLRHTRNS